MILQLRCDLMLNGQRIKSTMTVNFLGLQGVKVEGADSGGYRKRQGMLGDIPSCMYPFIYPSYHSHFTFILLYLPSFVIVWLSP